MTEKIILYFFAFIAFCFIIDLMNNISNFFKEKRNYQFMINKQENDSATKIDMIDRIDASVEILNLINTLIDNEISKTLQSCVRLKTKYDITKLDKDVSIIATTVYESLKPELFLSNELIITDKFLMQHIADEVMMRLLKNGQDYNENFYKRI